MSPDEMNADQDAQRPLLRIVRGTPDEIELAALTAVVAAAVSAVPSAEPPKPRSAWADRARLVRSPLRPAPGAWRASALPR